MSKRRLTSSFFDILPDQSFNIKMKPNDIYLQSKEAFPTQEAPHRLLSHTSKIIMNKINLPSNNENINKINNNEKLCFSYKEAIQGKTQFNPLKAYENPFEGLEIFKVFLMKTH